MALWHFLAYFIFASCLVAEEQTRYVLKGLEVSLNPGIPKRPDNILWMHKGNKVVEFNGQEEEVYKPFTDRITLDWHTAELRITNLGFQDTGDYELEAYKDSTLHTSKFNLEVIDEVPKPTISCEMTDCSSSNMSAALVCATDAKQPQTSTKFEWSSNGKTQSGSKLTIHLREKNDAEVYTCTVSNPLSVETATFAAKDCYSDCSSAAPIIIPVILVIMLVLVGLVAITIYFKRHRKACFDTDVEKQTKSDAKEGSAEETEPLVNNKSTSSSNQQQHQGGGNLMPNEAANSHKGGTDSDPNSSKVDDMNLQDETPQKGLVEKMRHFFETPEKSKDKPEETASPSSTQQSEPTSSFDQNTPVRGKDGDSDADQLGKEQTEIPQSEKEPDQAEVPATSGEGNQETSTSPEQSALEKNKDEETASPSPSQTSEAPPPSDQNELSSSDRDDANADQLGKQQTEVSHTDNEAVQPGDLSSSQDTKSNVETSTSPEQQALEENKDEETASPSFSQPSEQTSSSDQNNLSSSDRGDPDTDQDRKQQTEVSHTDNEAVQPGASSSGQDTKSNEETSTSHEQPEKDNPEETVSPSPPQQNEAPPPSDQNELSSSDRDDANADQLGKQQTEVSQSDNEAVQPGVLSSSRDTESNVETSTSPEQPALEENKDEETASPSFSQPSESPPPSDQSELSRSDRGDPDADQLGKQQTEVSHSDNEAVQPGASSSGQDTESNVETSTSPEQQGSAEETNPLVNNKSTSSSKQPQNQGGGNQMPNEAASLQKGGTDSDPNSTEGLTEETEPFGNNTSTPSSNKPQNQGGGDLMPNEGASLQKGGTDPDPNSAEGNDMDVQDGKPPEGIVKRRITTFEPEKSKDKPEENAPPSPSQQSEQTSSSDQKKPVRGEDGDSDADQLGKQETEKPQSVKEPYQAKVSPTS